MIEKLKNTGGVVLGIALIVGVPAIAILILFGLAQFSVWSIQWTPTIFAYAFWSALALIPFAIIPPTRMFAATAYILLAMVFGVILWLFALAFAYATWGLIPVIIGMVFFGVGVIFVGFLAALFTGTWWALGTLAGMVVLAFGSQGLSAWLAQKAEERNYRKMTNRKPGSVTLNQTPSD